MSHSARTIRYARELLAFLLIAVAGLSLLVPTAALACVAYTGWHVEYHGEGPLRAPAAGPLRLNLADGKSTEPFDPDEIRLSIFDEQEVQVEGTYEVVDVRDRTSILWTPSEPLAGARYRVELRHPAGGGTMLIEELVPTEIPETIAPPEILSARAWERAVPVDDPVCCPLAECREGECSDSEPVCEACWHEEYVYPIVPLVRFDYPDDALTHWLEARFYKVEPDGSTTRVSAPYEIEFPEGTPGPYCVIIELHDPESERSSREEVCIPEEAVTRIPHEVHNDSKRAECRDTAAPPLAGCASGGASGPVGVVAMFAALLAFVGVTRRRSSRRA